MADQKQIGFTLFIALWNKQQGQGTPDIHFRMAAWLEEAWVQKDTQLLLQAFRSSGKSTIVGLFAAWLLYRNPDLRIMVLAADLMLSRKMVRNVKRIIERHPLTQHLKPSRLDQWGAERFTVERARELRDPSMLARGITANITGSRADVIICDDVEVPNTCDTAEKRSNLREKLAEIPFVLVPGGLQLYVGTPHSWYTIYAAEPRTEIGETAPFLAGFSRLSLPVLDEKGKSAWPERFKEEMIARMKKASGPNRFNSQMMLLPVNIAEGRLDPALFRRYEAGLDYIREINLLQIGDRKIVAASAWWDPAFGGGSKGDGSVLAVIYTDETGAFWLHRLTYIKADAASEQDEATQQCRQIAAHAKELLLPSIAVEINGIGRFLPNILRRELAKARVPCAVQEVSNSRPKDIRIMEAFDTVMAARLLHVHSSVYSTPFIAEMQEWSPGKKGGRDDGLDAVAGALLQSPMRLKRYYKGGQQLWKDDTSSSHKAQTEFEV